MTRRGSGVRIPHGPPEGTRVGPRRLVPQLGKRTRRRRSADLPPAVRSTARREEMASAGADSSPGLVVPWLVPRRHRPPMPGHPRKRRRPSADSPSASSSHGAPSWGHERRLKARHRPGSRSQPCWVRRRGGGRGVGWRRLVSRPRLPRGRCLGGTGRRRRGTRGRGVGLWPTRRPASSCRGASSWGRPRPLEACHRQGARSRVRPSRRPG